MSSWDRSAVKINSRDRLDGGTSGTENLIYKDITAIVIYAGNKDDVFVNNSQGKLIVYGGAGNDSYTGNSGANVFFGGVGNDRYTANPDVSMSFSNSGYFEGGDGNDVAFGGGGTDYLAGGNGLGSLSEPLDRLFLILAHTPRAVLVTEAQLCHRCSVTAFGCLTMPFSFLLFAFCRSCLVHWFVFRRAVRQLRGAASGEHRHA